MKSERKDTTPVSKRSDAPSPSPVGGGALPPRVSAHFAGAMNGFAKMVRDDK